MNDPTLAAGHLLDPIFTNFPNIMVDKPTTLTWTNHSLVRFDLHLPRTTHAQTSRRNWIQMPEDL